jgi:hypothetical protein
MRFHIKSAKVGNRFLLKHQIHRGSVTAKGLGKDIGKDRRKAVIIFGHGFAMESGCFGRTSHGYYFADIGLGFSRRDLAY